MTPEPTPASTLDSYRKNTVRETLTGNHPHRKSKMVVENKQYDAFFARIISGYLRRVASGDIEALADFLARERDLKKAIHQAVCGLRRDHGYSWADIARVTGITKQTAQEKWGGESK